MFMEKFCIVPMYVHAKFRLIARTLLAIFIFFPAAPPMTALRKQYCFAVVDQLHTDAVADFLANVNVIRYVC